MGLKSMFLHKRLGTKKYIKKEANSNANKNYPIWLHTWGIRPGGYQTGIQLSSFHFKSWRPFSIISDELKKDQSNEPLKMEIQEH